ncbi:MAG: multicopper oxidase domain-containing protein [Acidimicrobiia bacterium]|nr:multicopper oxidase domain-containing protein [Acidimicrobiia bacterium]
MHPDLAYQSDSGEAGHRPAVEKRSLLRRIVLVGTIAIVAGGVAFGVLALWLYQSARTDTVGELEFTQELKIPPLLEPERGADGGAIYQLEMQEGFSELLPGVQTETWGVNGSYLGPTIRAERGDWVRMEVENGLPEATTLHWHGMHLPADADGNPHQLIGPGGDWSPTWQIRQPVGTLWYHPHRMGMTADHVYRGLAGMFLIDDPENVPDELPQTYGVDDIPVIIQDKRFTDDGGLDRSEPFGSQVGQLGDTILVNGTYMPYLDVERERVRLRVLNASNGRFYNLQFADGRPFQLIGTDGGLLTQAQELTEVQVSPGERAEIIVTLEPGERTSLISADPDLTLEGFSHRFSGGDDTLALLELRAAENLGPAPQLPAVLAEDELPEAEDATVNRQFVLDGTSRINDKRMDMNRIDTVVGVDTTEIWEVTNSSGSPHSFHVHDVQFRVLEIGGQDPPVELTGAKDTVFIPRNATVRIAIEFTDYSDPQTPYMYHCHLLRHEDNGMMAQFTVVEADEVDSAPREITGVHDDHNREQGDSQ